MLFAGDKPVSSLSFGQVLVAGGLGGMGYWALCFPADIVKTAIQCDAIDPSQRKYKGARGGVRGGRLQWERRWEEGCGSSVRQLGAAARCGSSVRQLGAAALCGSSVRKLGAAARCGSSVRRAARCGAQHGAARSSQCSALCRPSRRGDGAVYITEQGVGGELPITRRLPYPPPR